jgi:alpha,alpha-trehalose phosphorylase
MMIRQPAFPVEPWSVRETKLDFDRLAQSESIFSLSNGHIGLRGNFEEGEPYGLQGTYLGGFYELRPLPYPEGGYGYPESGQSVVNITNGKVIRLLVGDEPLDVRYGTLRSHERVLDLRAGVLRRELVWTSPSGRSVRIRSTRLVSFSQRAIAAIEYEVEPVDRRVRVVIQSELFANEEQAAPENDPRAAAALAAPLVAEFADAKDTRAVLVHHARASGLRVAVAMDHIVECQADTSQSVEAFDDVARLMVAAELEPGARLRIVKLIAYGWSGLRSTPAMRDQVAAALAEAKHTGWDGLVKAQRRYLDRFWERGDVELDGDAELQQAARFGLFHVVQAGARTEQRAIAAKGLTGPGYDGHAFWDSETFVLPALTYTLPHAVADALRWRHSTLDLARARAEQLHLKGAAFPWRTINGEECSGYWPAGTAAFHINADIADAVIRYVAATDDEEFERDIAVELLVETARLWRSLGHHDRDGQFRIDGVTGPDEYSAIADNNVYTNLMAKRNLIAAAEIAERQMDRARELGVDTEEAASWRDAAADMLIPFDERRQLHPQAEGFLEHEWWNFDGMTEDQYPLLLHFPYFDLYRRQVIKQADLVLALHLRGDEFTDEQKARNFEYYEPLTVRDSSLSACTQAVIAAEVGHLDLAYAYCREAALMDLDDLEHNTRDGVHIASLAGAWIATVAGFGGMRDHGGQLSFKPRLPGALTRMAFRLRFRGSTLSVEVKRQQATYTLIEGSPLDIVHYGEPARITADARTVLKIARIRKRESPKQPPGREPGRLAER